MLSPFISVGLVSLVSLVGVLFLFLNNQKIKKVSFFFVSVAIGTMLADALLHILPEAYSKLSGRETGLFALGGILLFFLFERVFHWQHEHDPAYAEAHNHQSDKTVGYMSLTADGLHNFIDGLLIGSSYLISTEIGIGTTIAVILHEIPQEIGHFGILINAGFSSKKALFFNFLSAIISFLGLGVALLLQGLAPQFALWMLPVTAGGFIYIAGSDLIPNLHKKNTNTKNFLIEFFAICLGIAAMVGLFFFE